MCRINSAETYLLAEWRTVYRWHESNTGFSKELGNQSNNEKRKSTSRGTARLKVSKYLIEAD